MCVFKLFKVTSFYFQDSTDIVHVSTKAAFDPKSPCRKVWEDLMDDGMLTNKIGLFYFSQVDIYKTLIAVLDIFKKLVG